MPDASVIELRAAGQRWQGTLEHTRAPDAAAALLARLPLHAELVQDSWSRGIAVAIGDTRLDMAGGPPLPFQHAGQLLYDPKYERLALCYGDGRLQDGFGPIPVVPLAELAGDLCALEAFGRSLQFEGATEVELSVASAQHEPTGPVPLGRGREIAISLADAEATAVLLEDVVADLAPRLAECLPVAGRATNTVSSGPLTRFWNPNGGPNGELALHEGERDASAAASLFFRAEILRPGFVYYNTVAPWRGLRIAAREATIMKGVTGSASTRLVPVAQLVGDWSDFRAIATDLPRRGAQPMRITLRNGDGAGSR